MDNAKMKVGKNLTYMSVSRSIPVKTDRYDGQMSKKKHLQDPAYNSNNTHPEVNKSNIDRNFGKQEVLLNTKLENNKHGLYNMVQGTRQPYGSCIVLVQAESTTRL
jgi:hypothetical protein